jgi:hypothetical protein
MDIPLIKDLVIFIKSKLITSVAYYKGYIYRPLNI